MTTVWDETRVQQYIVDGVEESLNLDYKAAGALSKQPKYKLDITKDVSAMANSDGGLIIYGLKEDQNDKHLPGQIDPINRRDFSKEWLEQVASNIRPKIDGLLIHPVSIGNSTADAAYVVEIPKSHTAHQAMDKRYYKRFNFQSVMMDDYEIRDVMNRRQHPLVELKLEIVPVIDDGGVTRKLELRVIMQNSGNVLAKFIEAHVWVPTAILFDESQRGTRNRRRDGISEGRTVIRRYNRERFAVGNSGPPVYKTFYGTPLYVPLFPGLAMSVEPIDLNPREVFQDKKKHFTVKWSTFADDAAPNSGEEVAYDILR